MGVGGAQWILRRKQRVCSGCCGFPSGPEGEKEFVVGVGDFHVRVKWQILLEIPPYFHILPTSCLEVPLCCIFNFVTRNFIFSNFVLSFRILEYISAFL